jgi:hypothetical protein
MPLRREQWTRLNVPVVIEAPRANHRFNLLFISPGGLFVPCRLTFEPSTQLTIKFKVDERAVVAHTEVRRVLTSSGAQDRGIQDDTGGIETRIVRMEGDGSQILAEHIKKLLMESGGPT